MTDGDEPKAPPPSRPVVAPTAGEIIWMRVLFGAMITTALALVLVALIDWRINRFLERNGYEPAQHETSRSSADRAPASEAGCRRFESSRDGHCANKVSEARER